MHILHNSCMKYGNSLKTNNMTQKEIKEKMTTGEWVCDTTITNIDSITTDCIEISSNRASWWIAYVQDDKYCKNSGEHDAAAIVSAINNTYDKNINPESVPELYNVLRMLRGRLSDKVDKEVLDILSEIIKNATL
jgi:hypothetical protein